MYRTLPLIGSLLLGGTAHAQIIQTKNANQHISQPAAFDGDGDGISEIVSHISEGEGQPEGIYAFAWDGTPLWSNVTNAGVGTSFVPLTICEIDGTPGDEIIGKDRRGIHSYDGATGAWLDEYTSLNASSNNHSPIVAHDFNNDGIDEIIVGLKPSTLVLLDHRMRPLPGWPITLPRGTDVYNIVIHQNQIVVATAPGVFSDKVVYTIKPDGTIVDEVDYAALDMLVAKDELYCLSDVWNDEKRWNVSINSIDIDIGRYYFKEWTDEYGHIRRRYTVAACGGNGFHADVLAASGNGLLFSTSVSLIDWNQPPFGSPVITVLSTHAVAWKVDLDTMEAKKIGQEFLDRPLRFAYPVMRKGFGGAIAVSVPGLYRMKIYQHQVVETSADRRDGWHRVTPFFGPVVLTNADGRRNMFVPMIGGEMFVLPAPDPDGLSYPEYRGGSRRKGIAR